MVLPLAAALSGCGGGTSSIVPPPAPVAQISPSGITFDSQNTGTASTAQAISLQNTGNAPLAISNIALTGANPTSFTLSTGANPCGSSLAAQAGCNIYVTSTPAKVGATSATLTVTDNSATPTQSTALTGFGIPGPGPGQTPDTRADAMLGLMTQAEKLQLVQGGALTQYNYTAPRGAAGWVPGIARLGIPELYLADGSVGVGNAVGPATALPSSLANAASWDLNEATKYGTVIGTELAAYGINVNLGGNINLIGREPRDGRTFETKGEDPILAGKITAAHIAAIQAEHVIGGIKHFAFNDQETDRQTINAVIDERAARESDLLAFEIGIKDSDAQSVMCAYNKVNGQYNCENEHLLNDVLKGDWAFPGFVMSDWWATQSTATAANNGLDQEQPDRQFFSTLGAAVTAGQVPQSRLDNMVHRILRAMYAVGLFDNPEKLQPIPAAADAAVAQEIEETGAVLLRNTGGQLPLNGSTVQSIAVIGLKADQAVLSGGGSAQVQPVGGAIVGPTPCPPCWSQVVWDPSSPLKAIQAMAPGARVSFADGTNIPAAAALAATTQVAIVFVNQWASEGMDETSLNLWIDDPNSPYPMDQSSLVAAVVAANPHTIVVIESGGPVFIPWLDPVPALLEAWYPGQKGGEAIANILFGAVNPSGKLPVTFPSNDIQLPRASVVMADSIDYNGFGTPEGYNVGYKWFDSTNQTPWFPFGFGLSYTTFSITNPVLQNNLASLSKPNFQVAFKLANTGPVTGAEVPQVYLGLPASLKEPPHRLVGWQKVSLSPGASRQVTIEVDLNDSSHPMSWWNTGSNSWEVAPGVYTVYLGTSSAASALTTVGTITLGP